MGKIGLGRVACIVTVFSAAGAISAAAQTLTTLAIFKGNDGSGPQSIIQGTDGNFYGADWRGGGTDTSSGTAFEVATSGKVTVLYAFCSPTDCSSGGNPSGLMQASNGNFYGTTYNDGTSRVQVCDSGCGAVFEITPGGEETTLYDFCSQKDCSDGRTPEVPLLQGANGNLFGTTAAGGIYGNGLCGTSSDYCGTIFEITLNGQLTTLYRFCSLTNCADGEDPHSLVQGADRSLYGATLLGGANGFGTFFALSPEGTLTTLYNFNEGEGGQIKFQGADGNFYGISGGVFRITTSGQLTVLYSFCSQTNCSDGYGPAALLQATDGNFYGVTYEGGSSVDNPLCERRLLGNGCGTIFKITPAGQFSTLYNFCSQANCADGSQPAALTQGTDGNLYGLTSAGPCPSGKTGCGTFFSFSLGLTPFVSANPTFGKAGYEINILGNNLTGTTRVTFGGVPATFTVVSGSLIKATVPAGANTGTVEVTTPSATLSSNVAFQILQ
jgi:uncharacterized repeat protein (TIGR03803 family)